MEEILKRLEYLANQIGNLNLGNNVVEVKPSEGSRGKTSLPDEPEIYGASCFVMHDLIVDLARTISGKYSCFLQQNDDIDRLEKKTRHLGCHPESLYEAINPSKLSSTSSGGNFPTTLTPLYLYPPLQSLRLEDCGSSFRSLDMDLFPNLKTLYIQSSHYFEAISMSNGKSLEELTSLSIWRCDSFVSFPNGGLIAPKLSRLEIVNCRKLKWLPEKLSSLSSLESLKIYYCPLIETFPEGEAAKMFEMAPRFGLTV
ncbi:hypothetical protein F8388_025805 [Cannabis sativa]|uniref:Uncharacterized protein n=1 Tax=Cannabis sativa TaxID=3483 RepID=A0A7J6F9H3_CANSA|nr:hypothetical protein F8388_025805 [Cannabis sativa]